jgi:hypothetical protein
MDYLRGGTQAGFSGHRRSKRGNADRRLFFLPPSPGSRGINTAVMCDCQRPGEGGRGMRSPDHQRQQYPDRWSD